MEEYAYWFWGNIFSPWGIHDRVDWTRFKERLKMHSKPDRDMFWFVYRLYKEAPDKNWVTDDYEKRKEDEERNRIEAAKLL